MQRNRWETAIRCLEIAVHPNTTDEEIIAAVNGFRRTAGSTPLSRLCREFAAVDGMRPTPSAADEKDRLDRLDHENLELRRKIEEIEDNRNATLRRLHDAEQRAQEIGEELLAAQQRADAAEQRLGEFRGAYGRISGGLNHENVDLRRALDAARRNMAQPIHEPVRPFQNVLNAALQQADPAPAGPPAPVSSRPWTA